MGPYIINLDQYKTIETYWIALYVKDDNVHTLKDNNVTYFDSFGVEHISKEIKKLKDNKKITTNIENKQMIYCVNTFVLDFLILW